MSSPSHPSAVLSETQIAFFHENGYLALDQISPPEEVRELGEIFERLFSSRVGWEQGRAFDLAGTDDEKNLPSLPQIINPVEFAPELAHTRFRGNALAIARQLLGATAEHWFEHAINKPARIGAATPWHQDEAHRYDPGVDYQQISIWMPLQPATPQNGCMQYIPHTHRGPVLEHHSLNDDSRVPALECIGAFDPARAVLCPLPPGGAAIHHSRTLHCASSNTTMEPRRAYILAFRSAPSSVPFREIFPWLQGKKTAAADRERAWKNRGGVIGRSSRKTWHALSRITCRIAGKISRTLRS